LSATELVYGVLEDNLVLLPESFALALAADYRTLESVRTYGDARAAVMTHLELPGASDEERDEHEDSEPYNPSEHDSWPIPVATWALDVLPEELEIGEQQEEGLMGLPTLVIDPGSEAEVLAQVTRLGFTIRRDGDLIRALDH